MHDALLVAVTSTPRSTRLAAAAIAALLAGTVATAQCTSLWGSSGGLPGTDSNVAAIASWDPDGAGPLPARIALGGSFLVAGGVPASFVARWNGSVWAPLAVGGTVSTQLALPDVPALAGTVFHHQVVALALDPTLAVTATNAVTMPVGVW